MIPSTLTAVDCLINLAVTSTSEELGIVTDETVRVPFGAAIIIDFLDLSSLNTGHVFASFQSLFANALIIEESR